MEFFQFLIVTALAIFFMTETGMEFITDLLGWLSDKLDFKPKNKIIEWLGVLFIGLPLMALIFLLTHGLRFASMIWIIMMLIEFIIIPILENAKDVFGWY